MAGNISIESFATKTRDWYRANYSHFHRNKNWNLFVHSIFFSRTEFSFHLLPYLSILRKDRVNQFEIPGHGRANRLFSRILRFDFKGLNSTKFFFFKELSLTNSLNWDFHLVKKKKNIQYQTHSLFNYTRKLFMPLESQADFFERSYILFSGNRGSNSKYLFVWKERRAAFGKS